MKICEPICENIGVPISCMKQSRGSNRGRIPYHLHNNVFAHGTVTNDDDDQRLRPNLHNNVFAHNTVTNDGDHVS